MRSSPFLLLSLLVAGMAQATPMAEHRVLAGETLISVRDRLLAADVGWKQLQKLNRVADPYRLQPGRLLRFPAAWLREVPARAEVLQIVGTVWLERGGLRTALTAGEPLRDGDLIASEAQSSATLRFADGTRSLVRPFSQVELSSLRQSPAKPDQARSELTLKQGALDTEVPPSLPASAARGAPPRFQLRTPVANLGVRGTRLRSHGSQERLLLEVLDGKVEASLTGARAAEAVSAGEGWVSGQGREALLPATALVPPSRIERLPVQLQWPALAGAAGYRLQWWDAQGQQLLLDAEMAAPQFVGAAALPDGSYRLRLRARSPAGLEGQDQELSVQIAARPEPPVLEAPAEASRSYAERQRFAWTRPQGAVRWRLQVADGAGFAAPRLDDVLDSNERSHPLPEGTHHWRVASLRADGHQGPWSDAQQLTRLPLPPSPPPAEPRREGDRLQLRWARAQLDGARYQVQADRAAGDFSAPWFDEVVSAPQAELPLALSGKQQLRIRVISADGQPGPWGAVQQFDGKSSPWWWLLLPALLLVG